MKIFEFKNLLKRGCVKFAFLKKDGTIRVAYGSTSIDSVPVEHTPKNPGKYYEGIVKFFDVVNLGWRSAKEDSLIGICGYEGADQSPKYILCLEHIIDSNEKVIYPSGRILDSLDKENKEYFIGKTVALIELISSD